VGTAFLRTGSSAHDGRAIRELAYSRERHLFLSTNARATPYVVAGGGVNSERDKAIDSRSAQKVVNAGFGV
jgi:hypothetical protein